MYWKKWKIINPLCTQFIIRNDPRFRENFELLARKGSKWLESHPPKIKELIE
jgi:hypothetical protein